MSLIGGLGKIATKQAKKVKPTQINEAQDEMLGALVAMRQTGALEQAAKQLKLNPEQLVRGYAGDQRSANAVRKTLQEQENVAAGLPANPGRRKVLKQAAGAAVQSQIPGSLVSKLVNPLDEGMARAMQEANIPLIDPQLVSTKLTDFMLSGNLMDEMHDMGSELAFPQLLKHSVGNFYPREQLPYLNSALDKLMNLNKQLGDDLMDSPGDLMYYQSLSKALKGKKPKDMEIDDWEILSPHIPELGISPQELEAIKHFERKALPFPGEMMDDLLDNGNLVSPPTTNMKEFNRWIMEQLGD